MFKDVYIKVTEENQYAVQKYLFSEGYSWIRSKTDLFDLFKSKIQSGNIKYITISYDFLMYNNIFNDTLKVIDGEIFLRKNKIKRLL